MTSLLPFHLAPAPKVVQVSEPVDLGKFNETYAGWVVVFNLALDLATNELIASTQDESVSYKDRAHALAEWVSHAVVAWNFVDSNGDPLPQPTEGGAALCPLSLIEPVSRAYAEVIAPKKQ